MSILNGKDITELFMIDTLLLVHIITYYWYQWIENQSRCCQYRNNMIFIPIDNMEEQIMHPQIKDHFYDDFLTKPTKDNFQKFMKDSCGELNEVDFKEQWSDKGSLAKIMLSMGNNGGGIVVFGVEEKMTIHLNFQVWQTLEMLLMSIMK